MGHRSSAQANLSKHLLCLFLARHMLRVVLFHLLSCGFVECEWREAAHSLASCAPWQHRVGDLRWLAREKRGDGAHTAMERSLLAVTAMTQKHFRILPSASRQLGAFLAIWLC